MPLVVPSAKDADPVLYALFVVPREGSPELAPAFERMVDSLRVNDRVAHR